MADKKRVLFLCVGNSCRSQMAEGLLRGIAPEKFDVHSAGAKPAGLNPNAVRVMAEIGIDLSGQRSKSVEEYAEERFDFVATVCDNSASGPCPVFLGKTGTALHWPFFDPAEAGGSEEELLDVFRRVRDEIKAKLEAFVKEHPAARSSTGHKTYPTTSP
ncbi:MAG: arsenate reductase ArsC [Planctomycetes bacterium]|nr:arsenate reductase ArsC [Planctomycetota bacterium]